MGTNASQITSLAIVYSIVFSSADQRKHQSSASLAFVRGIHRGPVNSPHKWPVTRKMFPFDDVIMDGFVQYFGISITYTLNNWYRLLSATSSFICYIYPYLYKLYHFFHCYHHICNWPYHFHNSWHCRYHYASITDMYTYMDPLRPGIWMLRVRVWKQITNHVSWCKRLIIVKSALKHTGTHWRHS